MRLHGIRRWLQILMPGLFGHGGRRSHEITGSPRPRRSASGQRAPVVASYNKVAADERPTRPSVVAPERVEPTPQDIGGSRPTAGPPVLTIHHPDLKAPVPIQSQEENNRMVRALMGQQQAMLSPYGMQGMAMQGYPTLGQMNQQMGMDMERAFLYGYPGEALKGGGK